MGRGGGGERERERERGGGEMRNGEDSPILLPSEQSQYHPSSQPFEWLAIEVRE